MQVLEAAVQGVGAAAVMAADEAGTIWQQLAGRAGHHCRLRHVHCTSGCRALGSNRHPWYSNGQQIDAVTYMQWRFCGAWQIIGVSDTGDAAPVCTSKAGRPQHQWRQAAPRPLQQRHAQQRRRAGLRPDDLVRHATQCRPPAARAAEQPGPAVHAQ